MNSFQEVFEKYDWDTVKKKIYNTTSSDVEASLLKSKKSLEDFAVLISPAGTDYLEELANQSQRLTKERFGNTIQLFAPMYLSNECQNICTYCGFSMTNKIPRKTLSDNEILKETEFLKSKNYDHILLVTGEANRTVGVDYLENALKLMQPHFSNLSIEVQPLEQDEYERLTESGLYGVLVYQETYHQKEYKKHHPKGKKSNFLYRLDTPDRLGRAGVHKIGLGALLGLEDWRVDSFFTALHLDYLKKKYWKTQYSVSFPRLRPFSGGLDPKVEMNERELTQLICAYRVFQPDLEISLSTRERKEFRDFLIPMGVTTMSAESKTNPGGYTTEQTSLEQFEISDERPTEEIVKIIQEKGKEVVWKNWDGVFVG